MCIFHNFRKLFSSFWFLAQRVSTCYYRSKETKISFSVSKLTLRNGDNMEANELKESILKGTIQVFNKKGLKFTMDDIARELSISKKTIYTVFTDKGALFLQMVDYIFDSIKDSEQRIMEDDSLPLIEKIRQILSVMPEGYRDIDFRQLYLLKDKYPSIYAKVEKRLETGWENTIELLNRAMEEGLIRRIDIPILKLMLEASIEQFFQRDILIRNGLTYQEALSEVVDILVEGIRI